MKVYRSKRDLWVLAVVWSVVGFALAMTAPAWSLATTGELIVLVGIVVAVDAAVLWVVYGTGYWFDADQLHVRCGPIRLRIPVASIVSVQPTDDPRPSPAWSSDRLAIRHAGGTLLISPADPVGFMEDLRRRCAADIGIETREGIVPKERL